MEKTFTSYSYVHQRSWWEIVISAAQIANIQLHHMHYIIISSLQILLHFLLLTNAKVLWPLLKQGVDYFFGLMFLGHRRGRCHLLPLSLLSLRLPNKKKSG